MREIKFRAWHKENGMSKSFSLQEAIEDSDPGLHSTEGVIYMQYTGLKDKNGNEIYEGDIVDSKDGKSEVVWGASSGAWSVPDIDGEYCLSTFLRRFDVEVIGNIYENPESLK